MEQIKQLRQMRDAARARIEATPDYKLMTSLDALITDLEKAFGQVPGDGEATGGSSAPSAGGGSGPAGQSGAGEQQARAEKAAGKAPPSGIFNGDAAKAANPEEDAIDQAVAELEAELVSVNVGDKNH